jgi:hypothetical protein
MIGIYLSDLVADSQSEQNPEDLSNLNITL